MPFFVPLRLCVRYKILENLWPGTYITLREQGQNSADLAYSRIKAFPLTFVNHIDENLLITAGTLKANYPISYADSFAAALAKIHECFLLSGDPEFKVLEKEEIIQVEWLS